MSKQTTDLVIEKGSKRSIVQYFEPGQIIKTATGQEGIDGFVVLNGDVNNSKNRLIIICIQAKSTTGDYSYHNSQLVNDISDIKTFTETILANDSHFKGKFGKKKPYFIANIFSNKNSPKNEENNLENIRFPFVITRGENYKNTVGLFKRAKLV